MGEAIFCLRGGRKIRIHNEMSPQESEHFFSDMLDGGGSLHCYHTCH